MLQLLTSIGSILLLLNSLTGSQAVASVPPSLTPTKSTSGKTAPLAVIGTIKKVQGDSWVIQDFPEKAKVKAKEGMDVHDGDALLTEGKSEMTVVFGKKEIALTIKPNSLLKAVHTTDRWVLVINEGAVLSHTPASTPRSTRIQFVTQAAVIDARSATFFLKSELKKDVFLCACNGTIAIDEKVLILGKNHNAAKWIAIGQTPVGTRLKNASQGTDHTDAEAKDLAKLLL